MQPRHDANDQTALIRRGEASGIVTLASPFTYAETVERLEQAVRGHGLTLFAEIDHSGEADRVGLTLRPTKLLIFGNPVSGTPAMDASPLLALDLPLKALVWQDADGHVRVSYNAPTYLAARHAIPDHLVASISGIVPLIAGALDR